VIDYIAKAAIKVMANVITKRATNRELFEAIKRKKARSKRTTANLGKAQVMSIAVVEERRKVLDKKRFKKKSQYLSVINFCIFDDVIPSSPQKKSPQKKSTQKKPAVPVLSIPYTILALSLNLTSTSTTVSTMAKELETTTLKSPAIAPKSSTVVPRAMPVTTRSGRIIKRRSS
jgi:hypothetical protein